MATLQGKAVKNTYRQVLQIGANNVGVSGTLQPVQDGAGVSTALSLSTTAATVTGDLTITGDLIITGGGIQIQDLIDDTVATLIQNGTGITWAYNDTLRTLTPTITIATADGGAQADYFQFNVNAAEASAVGKLKWNTTDGTMDIGLMGGNVVLQVGQEQVARVLNNSGSILQEANYQAVKISSAQGQRLAVVLAQANNEANSTDTLGLVTENIANNQEGFVTTSGLVRQIDTTGDLQSEVWVDGDTLYLSPSIPGGVTKVKPVAPQQTVIVGFVVYAHKTQGKIFVKVDNGYELDELHNVKITSVANNNILKYNSSLAVWENVAGTTTNIAEGTNLYYTQARFNSAFAAKTTTDLAEGTNLYFTSARGDANFATNFATKDTDDLPEGTTNLYFTNARSRNALSVTAGTGISYNSTTGNFELASIPNASLTNSSVTINGQAVALGASLTLTTSDIAEGTNLYWTNARFDSRFSTKTTTDLAEGTNLYYTQARFNSAFSAKSTTDLTEGTNLYYTDARARAAFSENAVGLDYSSGSGVLSLTSGYAIPTTVKLGEYDIAYNRSIVSAAVTGTSTKTLTLTEQDANTITATWTDQGITTINGTANQIAASTVGNTTTVGFTNDVTFPNNVVVSGNLTINGTATYVNTQSISSKDPLFEVANDNNTTDAVDIGYYGRYYDSAQTRVEFTGLFRDASDAGKFKMFTGLVDEPTNVVDTTGTGYTVGTLVANVEGNLAGTANAANVLSTARTISATGDAAWSVSFDGSANASAALTLANTGVTASTYGTTTAVPTIAIDGKGRITSASNTNIAFPVTTVNGQSGTVVLTTSDVAEGTNQYFTSARAQASITGGASSVVTADLTASRALVSDGSGKIAASVSTTSTEIGYLAGVTSAIQTQLNAKAADNAVVHLTGTETITGAKTFTSLSVTGAQTISNAGSGDYLTIQNSDPSIGGGETVSLVLDYTQAASSTGWKILSRYAGGNLQFVPNKNNAGYNNFALSLDGTTGAATFGSSVTSGTYLATQGGNELRLYNSSNNSYSQIYNSAASGSSNLIISGGNVGIAGTPSYPLHVFGAASNGQFVITSNVTGAGYGYNYVANQGSLQSLWGSEASGAFIGTNTNHYFYILSNGTERLRVDADGTFTVKKGNQPVVNLKNTTASGVMRGAINWYGADSTNIGAQIYADGESTGINSNLYFYTKNASTLTERIRITSGGDSNFYGNVNIIKTTPGLILNGTGSGNSGAYINILGWASSSKNWQIGVANIGPAGLTLQVSTTAGGSTFSTSVGNFNESTGAYTATSDINRKKDFELSNIGLNEILNLKPTLFRMKDEDENSAKHLGFIAQEVAPYIPQAYTEVGEGNTKFIGLTEMPIIAALVKSVQQLEARVKELEAK